MSPEFPLFSCEPNINKVKQEDQKMEKEIVICPHSGSRKSYKDGIR
jgi:hypothetical protein